MNNQLENITTQYEKFRKEQRISHESFNKFLGYFDDQDRLSRTLLNGVGIACGFEVTPLYGRVLDTTRIVGVKINQGAGVTTDGTLMTLYNTITKPEGVLRSSLKDISIPSKVYTHYKAYEYDSAKFGYSPFAGSKIWELVTEEDKTSEHLPIETLADIANLNVFLHEEQYEKELKPCVGIDCDSHGIEVKTSLKVLLVDETRMSGILRRDTIFKGTDTAQLVRDLPLLKLKRPVLDASTNTWKLIRDKYVQIIKEKDSNSKDILDRLLEASTKIFSYFGETNLLTKEKVEFWYPRILDDINFHSGFQHIYNFINDLLDTYEELRSLLVDIRMVCVPDVRSFPKHLMLGKVKPSDTDKRHQFYYTGVLDHEAKVDRAKLLLKRFNEQITQFNIPYYIPPATSRSLWKSALPQGIRISPSLQYGPLGEKAIPHYYKKSDDLAYAWNFDATRARTKNQPMGYHYNHGDPNSRVIALLTGIVYNHDDKDFYRIEGQLHHGERFTKAFETLKTQINQFNLDFDVIGVSLTDIKDNKDKNRASYSDYIKQHPGITHMSGVPAGGTLVLVYESASSEQIIGDFALPYRCCTEKENTSVSLGASTLCNNGKPVPFNFEPVGATVEALAKGAKIAPFKTIGTQLYFDPSLVTGTALNEEITFKVNGKLVETKVTVKPALDLTVAPLLAKTDVVLDYESQVVSVKFKITEKEGNPLSNITSYEWSFGDGVVSNQIPVDKVVVHSYKLTSLLNKTVKPTLKIESKGGCSSSFTMAEIDIKSILETIDCLAKEPKNIDALGASKSISFLIDYGSDKGLAGVNSILTIPAASQQTISVNYNGTVTEKIITKAQESFSFKKNIEAPLALVTLKSSVSVTDWKVNGICPIAVTAESITIESNACSTTAGTKSTVYVKPKAARTNVLPLQNEDILYADDLLSTVVKSDGAAKFIIPSTSVRAEQIITISAVGVVTISSCDRNYVAVNIAEGNCNTNSRFTTKYMKKEEGTFAGPVKDKFIYNDNELNSASVFDGGNKVYIMQNYTKAFSIDAQGKIGDVFNCNVQSVTVSNIKAASALETCSGFGHNKALSFEVSAGAYQTVYYEVGPAFSNAINIQGGAKAPEFVLYQEGSEKRRIPFEENAKTRTESIVLDKDGKAKIQIQVCSDCGGTKTSTANLKVIIKDNNGSTLNSFGTRFISNHCTNR